MQVIDEIIIHSQSADVRNDYRIHIVRRLCGLSPSLFVSVLFSTKHGFA